MSMLRNLISRRIAAKRLITAGVAGAAVAVNVKAAAQPHMEAALRALRNAKAQLEMATPDKAGHRVHAIELVNQAIAQVEEGIGAGDKL